MLPYDPTVLLLGICFHDVKIMCTQEPADRYLQQFIIAKTKKQLRCPSIGEWMSNPWYIQPMGFYSALKRKELSSHDKLWRNCQCLSLVNQVNPTKLCSDDPNYITFWKSQNYGYNKHFGGCPDWGERGINRWSTEGFQGSENILYGNGGYVITHLSRLIDSPTPKVRLNVNHGLWVVMGCQCRSITVTNVLLWGGTSIMEEAIHVASGGIWEISTSFSQLCSKNKGY